MNTRLAVGAVLSAFLLNAAAAQEKLEQSDLGKRMVADGYPIIVPQSQVDSIRGQRQGMKDNGYIEADSGVSRPEFASRAMEELQTAAADGRPNLQAGTDIVELTRFDATAIGTKVPTLPATALRADSRAYVLQAATNASKYIYFQTSFGTLLVDDFAGGKAYTDGEPDLLIAGQPAWLSVVKYPGNKWATAIAVSANNGHLLIVESDQRLQGAQRDAFVQHVEALVLSTY